MRAVLEVNVHPQDFDLRVLQASLLQGRAGEGGIATFTGYVRASNENRGVRSLYLEHYPGMTERSILQILEESAERWPLLAARVVHRVGRLEPGEQIVWVGVSAAHREAAFAACEFVMDYLKTRAPFWKKEHGPEGEHWVDARDSDTTRAQRWQQQQ
ncbi:molybdopterin synthase catalytic subunit MoaE [Haliea sp. E17]|uniref:molybdopterin synthase catalytic subunit MoaE n=1 Tax=Haliea sp. E17 TaxID=3401576 RepID=UPI003AAD3D7F